MQRFQSGGVLGFLGSEQRWASKCMPSPWLLRPEKPKKPKKTKKTLGCCFIFDFPCKKLLILGVASV